MLDPPGPVRSSYTAENAPQLSALYERYYGHMLRLAVLSTGGDLHQAEDLVQDAFLALQPRIGMMRRADAAPAYLRTTIINKSRTIHRRKARERRALLSHEHRPDDQARDATEHIDAVATVAQLLGALPRRQRQVVALRYWCDLNVAQTAAALGISQGAVKSFTSKGLARLSEVIDRQGGMS